VINHHWPLYKEWTW